METSASHLPSESSDDDDDGLLSRAREVIASESSDGSSYSESEDSLDLRKFSGNGETTAFTVADLPPESSVSEVEGHGLPEDDADGEFAGGWSPGQNAGSWVGRTSPLTEQAQVLVANVYLKTKRLASDVLAALAQAVGRRGTESRPLRVSSALLGISRVMVSRCVQTLKQREWVPRAVTPAEDKVTALPAHLQGDAQSDDAQLRVLRTLVRAALSLGDDGYVSYTRSVARLALAGVEVGNRYHGRHFAKEAVFLAARCVQVLHARSLRAPLPGLGISSSLALLMDGVPVGGVSLFGRHGSVIVLCVNSVSSEDGRLRPHMISWVLPTGGHGGEAVASSVLAALAATPAGLDGAALKGRLSLVGGDGATVLGGAARKSSSTQAAEILWRKVYGQLVDPVRDLGDDVVLRDVSARPRKRVERDAWLKDVDQLHAATEWDKWHREDLVLTRAVKAVPMAVELFEVCGLMDQWFNLGEGRLLLKKSAQVAKTRLRSGALPGLTRKVVGLVREPGHLLQNFPAYALGVHGRRAHTRAGHNGPTQGALVEGGRRLTSLDFVAFAALFKDLMGFVAPWTLAVQCSSTEPWALRRLQKKHEAELEAATSSLTHVRDFLRVLVLLRQHLNPGELQPLVDAFFYATPAKLSEGARGPAFGKLLPTFWLSLNGFLNCARGVPLFKCVELLIVPQRNIHEWACLGPHCQCASRQPGHNPQSIAVKLKGMRRKVRVPHWVGTPGAAKAATAHGRHTPIRFADHKRADLPSLGRAADPGRFRPFIRPPHASRCIVPWHLVAAFGDVDAAVSSALRFISEVAKQHASLFGAEGESAGMRRVVDAMTVCFDWEHLVARNPTAEHVREFATVARMLKPYLKHTEWPSAEQFPNVTHKWPSPDRLSTQYTIMCRRLRSKRRPPWWVYEGAVVEPMVAGGLEMWFANTVFGPRLHEAEVPYCPKGLPAAAVGSLRRALTGRIAMVLSSFLRDRSARGPFYVSLRGLAFVGYPWRGKKQPHKMRSTVLRTWRCRLPGNLPGGLVALTLPGMVGKLAYVRQPKRHLDWSAVSAALDLDPFFARGRAPVKTGGAAQPVEAGGAAQPVKAGVSDAPRSAWHALRIHNFCRPMGSPEAVVERVGSFMRQQWSPGRHLDAGALMDEVLLRDAQVKCLGGSRDERICLEVAKSMLFLGRRPLVSEAAKRARLRQGVASTSSSALRRLRHGAAVAGDSTSSDDAGSGPEADWLIDDWPDRFMLKHTMGQRTQKAEPECDDAHVRQAVSSAFASGHVRQQPLYQEDVRTEARPRADSVMREALHTWLETEDGIAWVAEKKQRHV